MKIEDNINITIDIASNDQILTITAKDGTGKVLETKTVETDNKKNRKQRANYRQGNIDDPCQLPDKALHVHENHEKYSDPDYLHERDYRGINLR